MKNNSKMLSQLNDVEKKRVALNGYLNFAKPAAMLSKVLCWLCFVTIVVVQFVLDDITQTQVFLFCFLFLWFLLIAGFRINYSISSKTNEYRKCLKKSLFKSLFDELSGYQYVNINSQKYSEIYDRLTKYRMTRNFTTMHCDDCVLYKEKDFHLEIYDLGLYNKVAVGRSTSVLKVFEGLLLISNNLKNSKETTLVYPRDDIKANTYQVPGLERVRLEDVEFEKYFDVYSSNQIDARYLLTSAFMERLLQLARDKDYKISCSFEKGKILIGIESGKDWFDIPPEKSVVDNDNIQKVFDDIEEIKTFVESLKINKTTGL